MPREGGRVVASTLQSECTREYGETLCIDVIKPTRDDIKMDELYEIITYSVASGFNMYDYMSGGVVNYNSSQEELLKDVSDYCKSNPSEPFLLAIFKTLMGDEN